MSKQIPNLLKYLQTPQVMLLLLGFSFALFATGFAGPVEVRKVCPRGPFGGGGGDPFTDAGFAGERITRVDVRSGDRIDAIQITYGTTPGPQHGGNGGSLNFFNLEANEFIVEVQGRADARVDQLAFVSNLGNIYGTFGGHGGNLFYATGSELNYIDGRADDELDQITFYFLEC